MSPFQGFWQNGESQESSDIVDLKLNGLKEPVKVYYDKLHIPHIFAKNDHDLFLVQGYLTAKDRLWQMDFLSRVVTGRLSEILGKDLLESDIYLRRIGMKNMTKKVLRVTSQSKELTENIEAYTNGVNQYIKSLSLADYPIEFKLLNYKPEAWTIEKSHLAYALLSQTLSSGDSDLEYTNALQLLGRDLFDKLFPEQLGNLDPVISSDRIWDFDPIKVEKPEIEYPNIKTKETIEKPDPLNGSNNFAVAPSKSKSGHVLLANEPDLSLTLPSIWHASHLHSNQRNVMGVTVPGTPVILIGFNDSIAWGVTNSPRDQVDWYTITFKNDQREEYLYNGQWFKTSKEIEEIQIANGETYYDTILYTHHGPLVYDRNYKGDHEKVNYAMRWIAHLPSTTFMAMNDVNKSNNYSDFTDALKQFQGPPQNFIFGSCQGDIAMWLPGKFPVKWEEQGKFLMDGSDPKQEWNSFIPFDHMMYQKNPSRGFVSSANQHQVDSLYPYYVYDHHYEYNRNRRINDRLRLMEEVSPKDLMKLQNDNFNLTAYDVLPTLLDYLDSSSSTLKTVEILKDWDYFNEPNTTAPTYFQVWWDILYQEIWDEFDTMKIAINKPNTYVTTSLIKNGDSTFRFFDKVNTTEVEDIKSLINESFRLASDSLQNWNNQHGDLTWAHFKNTTISHYLKLKPFSESEVKIGGYKSIVNAAAKGHGPSWRMVVELDPEGVKAWGIYPGSQTGNPGSPYYGHMISDWAEGVYTPLLFGNDISKSKQVISQQTITSK